MNDRKSFYDVSSFYNKRAVLKASYKGMRYQVRQTTTDAEEKKLEVTVWSEPFCFEKTPDEYKTIKDFEYTEEGLDSGYEWVCSQYDERREEWDYAQKFPLEVAKKMGIIGGL